MKRLKVLFLTPWYPTRELPVFGVAVQEQARAVRLFDDVTVLHLAGQTRGRDRAWRIERETDEGLTKGIATYRVWHRRTLVPGLGSLHLLRAVGGAFRRIVEEGFRPNVLHGHVHSSAFPALLLGRFHRLPVVVTEHSSQFVRGRLRKRHLLMARFALRRADAVLAVGQTLLRALEAAGVRKRLRAVSNVIDTELFHPDRESRDRGPEALARILFVAALKGRRIKGVPYLLEALSRLAPQRADWHLDLVGDGPERELFERRARELELSGRITFHGFKSRPEVAELMRRASFLVVASVRETFSMVAAEALASGLPVLATRCGGPEDFVTPEVGLLVPTEDPEALRAGLEEMLDRFERFRPARLAAYAAARFNARRIGEQLDAIYRECLQERVRPRGAGRE
ncbi:MAG: glycosyltransferase [Thermoanaerobaculia bacterium]